MNVKMTKRQIQLANMAIYRMIGDGQAMLNSALLKDSPMKKEDIPKLEQDVKELGELRLYLNGRIVDALVNPEGGDAE